MTLVWHPADDRVSVLVEDVRLGEAFELDVREGERPLDVFDHPYAYAAARPERATMPAEVP